MLYLVLSIVPKRWFFRKNFKKFGNYKFFCYICIVKVFETTYKNISKKVEINLEISEFFVIFVLGKFFENFLFIVFVFKLLFKGSDRNLLKI